MSKRVNFSEKTRRLTAEKVAYFCSNPNCCRLTIGPADDGKAHQYGEAAHIYAASSNGPRGNSSLSSKELVSEKNCLWLCNNCHELIDANPRFYTPELLIDWKQKAEKRAFEIVSNPEKALKLINKIERNNGLSAFFNDLFNRGDFQKVIAAIYELSSNKNLSENDKEELLFAQIRFDAFCARKNVLEKLKLVELASQSVKERVVDFAIECYDEILCEHVKTLSNNETKRRIATMIAEKSRFDDVVMWMNDNFDKINDKHMVNSIFIIGGVKNSRVPINKDNEQVSFRGGWLLDTCDTITGFIYDTMYKKAIDEKRIDLFLDKIGIYSWLDEYYIHLIFDNNFQYFPKNKKSEKLFKKLIEAGVSTPDLRINYFYVLTPKEKQEGVFEKAIKLGQKYNDHKLLSNTLLLASTKNPKETIDFIENNPQYFYNDLLFVNPYQFAKETLKQPFDIIDFLENKYIGEKTYFFYLLVANAYLIKGNNELFNEYWNKYKKDGINCDDESIIITLQVAFRTKDEILIKEICEKTTNVSALFCVADYILENEVELDVISIVINKLESLIGTLPEHYNRLMFNLCWKAQKYNKAIEYGKRVYFGEKNDRIAPYIIQILIYLAAFDEDDFICSVAKSSLDPYSLNILGQFYLKSGKTRKGWDYIARSIPLHNKIDDLSFFGIFIECELIETKKESDIYTYIVTEEGKDYLLMPTDEKTYYGDFVFKTSVYYVEEKSELCFAKRGETISVGGNTYKIKEIYDYFRYFHDLALKHIVSSPSAISIHGNSPEQAINQIFELVKECETKQNEFLKSTSGHPLPLFLFTKSFGKGLFAAIEALYFSKMRNSFFLPKTRVSDYDLKVCDGFLFDAEMVYLSHRLGVSKETIKNDKCRITALTKGALLNEIAEKESEFRGNREKGTLTLDSTKEKLLFNENNQDRRRNALKELQHLKQIVNSFVVVSPDINSYSKDQNKILSFFTKEKDLIDAEVLKGIWSGETTVSNNQIFHMGQQLGKGKVVDFSMYLSLSSCSALEAINIVKGIKRTNIKQYLTPDVFKSILNKIVNIKDIEEKNSASKAMVDLIKGNWGENWSKEDNEFHKALVYLASINQRPLINQLNDINLELKNLHHELISNYLATSKSNHNQ